EPASRPSVMHVRQVDAPRTQSGFRVGFLRQPRDLRWPFGKVVTSQPRRSNGGSGNPASLCPPFRDQNHGRSAVTDRRAHQKVEGIDNLSRGQHGVLCLSRAEMGVLAVDTVAMVLCRYSGEMPPGRAAFGEVLQNLACVEIHEDGT